MSAYHHRHPHAHGRRGIHEHRHGHRGERTEPQRAVVPWSHWFAVHRHVHPDLADEARVRTPDRPGDEARLDEESPAVFSVVVGPAAAGPRERTPDATGAGTHGDGDRGMLADGGRPGPDDPTAAEPRRRLWRNRGDR